MHRTVLAVVALMMVATACGGGDSGGADDMPRISVSSSDVDARSEGPEPADKPAVTEPPDDKTNEPTSPPAYASKEKLMDRDDPRAQAIADLANQTGVDPSDIDVVAHDQVIWRDGSLGCPEPGMMYTQALVEGYRIVLRAQGEEVSYHGSTGKPPTRCDNPDPNGAVGSRPNQ